MRLCPNFRTAARYFSALALVVLAIAAAPLMGGDVAGSWSGQIVFRVSPQEHPVKFDLKPDGGKLTGTFCMNDCAASSRAVNSQDGKIDGDKMSFSVPLGAPELPQMDLQGTLSGDTFIFVVSGNPPECGDAGCEVGHGTATRGK